MFGIKHTAGKALVLASVLAMTGGVAMAEQDSAGPGDGDRARKQHKDGEGRQRGERGERGERGDRGPRGDRGDIARRLFGGMDLSDDQKAQIKDIMKAHGDERKAWHEANKDAFEALREKMRAARKSEDKDAGQAVRDEIKALMDSAPKPDASHDQVRALLNEEQQATFDERIEKMRERMEKMKENRGDGPPRGRRGDGPPKGEHGMMGDGEGKNKDGRKARGGRVFGNLDLNDDQKAKLRETMQSDQTREEKMAAVREMLTDDQKAQLDKNIAKMKKYREENKGDRKGRGGKRGDGPKNKDKEGGDSEQLDL